MAYQLGSYTKELEKSHKAGDHRQETEEFCPVCQRITQEGDFSSAGEENNWLAGESRRIDAARDDIAKATLIEHGQGFHEKYPDGNCRACTEERGFTDI